MKGVDRFFLLPVVSLLIIFSINTFLVGHASGSKSTLVPVSLKQGKKESIQKTKQIRIPFIANERQLDKRVASYTHTFGREVFVTKDRESVYAITERKKGHETRVRGQGSGVRKPGYGPQLIAGPIPLRPETTGAALKNVPVAATAGSKDFPHTSGVYDTSLRGRTDAFVSKPYGNHATTGSVTDYSISGTIYQADGVTPITDADIWIGVYQGDPCGDYTYVAGVYTSDGVYTIKGLPSGTYYVRTWNDQTNYLDEWWASAGSVPLSDCSAAGSITISGASVTGKDFQLDTGYSISGTIYQADGVTPITGADILIGVYQGDPCGDYTYVAEGYTSDGVYTVKGLPSGTYYMCTWVYQANYLNEWWAGSGSVPLADCNAAGPITIKDTSVTGKDFQLDTGYSISGTIYQADGVTPITGAGIWIGVYQGDPCGNYTYVAGGYTSDGVYTVYGLPAGTYYVCAGVYQANYLNEWWAGSGSVPLADCNAAGPIVISDASVTGKDFQLDTGYSISGTIYQADGVTPITGAGIWIGVYQGDPCGNYTYVAEDYTSDGAYTVYGLPAGTYYVCAGVYQANYLNEWWAGSGSVPLADCNAAGPIVISDASVTGKDFQLDTGYSISGTIYQADGVTPITGAGIWIEVYQSDPCGSNTYVAGGYTSDGVYTVYGLPSGTYYVRTRSDQTNYLDEWWASAGSVPLSDCGAAEPIVISDASVTGKDFQLDNAYSISGTIYQADGVTPITDSGIGIDVYQGDPCGSNTYVAGGYTSDGVYTIKGLPSGTYYVRTWNDQANYLDEWWASAGSVPLSDCGAAGSITISGASVTGKDFQLDTGYSISGTIYQADGITPITGADILIGVYKGDPCGDYTYVAEGYTSDGVYTVKGLPSGTYYVCTWVHQANYLNEWWASARSVPLSDCGAAEPIVISGASVSGKDFQLDTGYSISGTIYQADGITPITGADIWIEVYQGDPCGDYTYVAEGYTSDGVYTVYGLPADTYYVCTWVYQANYLNEWWASAGSVPLSNRSAAEPITISGASVSGKDFQLDTGYSISGTIYQADGVTPITGAGIWIEVYQGDPCGDYTYVAGSYTSDGVYTVYGLPAGTYYVCAGVYQANYLNEWWAGSGSVPLADCNAAGSITISGASVTGKDFQLDTDYSISGTIYQADGVTLITDADIGIDVYQSDP